MIEIRGEAEVLTTRGDSVGRGFWPGNVPHSAETDRQHWARGRNTLWAPCPLGAL